MASHARRTNMRITVNTQLSVRRLSGDEVCVGGTVRRAEERLADGPGHVHPAHSYKLIVIYGKKEPGREAICKLS